MNLWTLTALVLTIVGITLLIAGSARRNRGNRRLCPRCRYDLSATTETPCSECGYSWTNSNELFRRLPRPVHRVSGKIFLASAIAIVLLFPFYAGRHWSYFVPRPLLSLALKLSVEEPPMHAGSQLPAPLESLKHSQSRWERLVWEQQAAMAVEQFFDLVEKSTGSIDDIERLVPAAIEAHAIFQQHATTSSEDAWLLSSLVKRVRSRQDELNAKSTLPLGTWAAAELQFFSGDSDRYAEWIPPPIQILELLSHSKEASVRTYTIERVALLNSTRASTILEAMADDPDPVIRAKAAQALEWRREIRGWQ